MQVITAAASNRQSGFGRISKDRGDAQTQNRSTHAVAPAAAQVGAWARRHLRRYAAASAARDDF
jgi:hypothetical protein